MDFLETLRIRNVERCKDAFQMSLTQWSEAEWGCAIAGETGELCNMLKKRMRGESLGVRDADVADEMADVIIYIDLLAARMGIDLKNAIRNKFNEVSRRRNSTIFLERE